MITSISWPQSALNFFRNRILICWSCSQIFKLFHTLESIIINPHTVNSLQACTIAAINIKVSILWPVHNTYPHRTHQYLTQGLGLSGSKTWILDVCIHETTHIVYSCILISFSQEYVNMEKAVEQLLWGTALQAGSSRVRFPIVLLEFFIDVILTADLWSWVHSASSRNEYLEHFLGVKSGRHIVTIDIWELQTLGTLWVCNRAGEGLLYISIILTIISILLYL